MLAIPDQRLANQRITSTPYSSPVEAIRQLGAVQAQEMPGVKWGLALRVANASDASIMEAYNTGQILRTHAMRPTWHFVLPEDLVWLQQLTSAAVKRAMGSYTRKLELTDTLLRKTNDILANAIAVHGAMTRQELKARLSASGVAVDNERLTHIVMNAELDSLIVSGPMQGKQHTYMLVSDRAPKASSLSHEEALQTLAKRYFTTRGPAQLKDFSWWSGLGMAEVRQAQVLLGSALKSYEVSGKTYWYLPPLMRPQSTVPRAFLLSVLDEYIIAYKDREAIARKSKQTPMYGEMFSWAVILDGCVVGSWKRKLAKDGVTIQITFLHLLSLADKKEIEKAALQYAHFLDLDLQLQFSN